jgi:ankyrin repeat protein
VSLKEALGQSATRPRVSPQEALGESTCRRKRISQTGTSPGALVWACLHGNKEQARVCRWLVERGFDPNSTTQDGTVALHWAVWQGHMHVCKWLVYSAGAHLGHCNSFGCNAIQWAAQTDKVAMCRWLAAAGLDIAIINNNGHSAVHKAASKGQSAVCAWLLNEECLGLRHLAPDGDGNTPEAMARLDGHAALADTLQAAKTHLQRAAAEGPSVLPAQGPFVLPGGAALPELRSDAPGAVRKGSSTSDISSSVRLARMHQQLFPVRRPPAVASQALGAVACLACTLRASAGAPEARPLRNVTCSLGSAA